MGIWWLPESSCVAPIRESSRGSLLPASGWRSRPSTCSVYRTARSLSIGDTPTIRPASCASLGVPELRRTPSLRSSRWRESLPSRTPVGPGASDKGSSIVGYYAPDQLVKPGMARALGPWQSTRKGWSLPAKLQPLTPLSQRSCVYYSGIGSGQSEESKPLEGVL